MKKTNSSVLDLSDPLTRLEIANDFSRYNSVLMIGISEDPAKGLTMHSKEEEKHLIEKYGSLIDYREELNREQLEIKGKVEKMGVIVHLAPSIGLPDGHYAMDHGIATPESIHLAPMGDTPRREEIIPVASYLKELNIPYNKASGCNKFVFEGGDFVPVGELALLMGRRVKDGIDAPVRTRKKGREYVKQTRRSVIYKKVNHFMLHLSTAMTYLGSPKNSNKIFFLINPMGIKSKNLKASLAKKLGIPSSYIEVVETAEGEEWSAGGFAKDGMVLLPKEGPRTCQKISDLGFEVFETKTRANKDRDGSIHCGLLAGYDLFTSHAN